MVGLGEVLGGGGGRGRGRVEGSGITDPEGGKVVRGGEQEEFVGD